MIGMYSWLRLSLPSSFLSPQLSGSFHSRCCRLAEEPHYPLDVLGHGCQEELLPHELQSAQAQATQSDLILEFREQGFHLFSFPLCLGELWRVDQLASALAGWLIHVNGEILISPTGGLAFLRTCPTTFAAADIGVSAVANIQADIVELFPRRTAIAIAVGLIREPLGTVERAVLSVDTVAGSHIGRDAPIRQPLQELPVPIGRVGRYRFLVSFLPLRETSEHVLRGYRFLTHPCCRRLYSDDHATVVVDQIVVVVPQSGRCPPLGGVGRIGIRGRYLALLMHRLFGGILLLQFHQVLAHGLVHLRRFR